jgi:DNA-binding MarR family transcriptional regulator
MDLPYAARMDDVEELRYLVLAAQRDGNRMLTALLRPLGLTPAQAEVLGVLATADRPLTVRHVGERLVCETGSPSRLVSSLVAAGYVDRGPDPDDGRASALALTPRGRRAAAAVRDVEARFHDELRGRLTPGEDTAAAMRVLRRIAAGGASAGALERRRGG